MPGWPRLSSFFAARTPRRRPLFFSRRRRIAPAEWPRFWEPSAMRMPRTGGAAFTCVSSRARPTNWPSSRGDCRGGRRRGHGRPKGEAERSCRAHALCVIKRREEGRWGGPWDSKGADRLRTRGGEGARESFWGAKAEPLTQTGSGTPQGPSQGGAGTAGLPRAPRGPDPSSELPPRQKAARSPSDAAKIKPRRPKHSDKQQPGPIERGLRALT